MRRSRLPLTLALALAAGAAALMTGAAFAIPEPTETLAVVMGKNARFNAISLHDLSLLYLAQIQTVEGVPLTPVNLASSHPARESFIRKVHGMTLFEMKQYWISMRLKGQGRPPISYDTEEAVRAAVRGDDHVIGYLPAAAVPAGELKILAVDGKRPGEAGYPL